MRLVAITILALFLFSCNKQDEPLKIATSSTSGSYYQAAEALTEVLKNESDIQLESLVGDQLSTGKNCELLFQKKVDFAFAQNDTDLSNLLKKYKDSSDVKIRTVTPVYPELLFICHPDTIQPDNLTDLLTNRRIGIGPKGSGTAIFMHELFKEFNIDTNSLHIVYCAFDTNHLANPNLDVSCAVTGFNNDRIKKILTEQHGTIFSLGDLGLAYRGSSVDGFCMKYPRSRPYIIPKKMIGKLPKEPVLTVAVDAVIWTRADLPSETVYQFVEAMYNNSQLLVQKNEMYASLNENFNTRELHFPLHEGARMFFDRDEPSFMERYAELFGVVFSILLALYGIGRAWRNHFLQQRKDRIDVYYAQLLEIENRIENQNQLSIEQEISNVKQLKRKAYELLMDEKLSANESFRIFISFANEILDQLKDHQDQA